jgi:hypothetical protein
MTLSRLLPGVTLILAVLAAVARAQSALLHGHWSYPVLLLVAAVIGLILVIWAFVGDKPKPGAGRALFRWAGAAAGAGLAVACLYLAPYPATAQPSTAVQHDGSGIWMGPQQAPVGIAFIPGALVDPRAYENIFAPIAEAGYPVYIAKPPLGLAFGVPDVVAQAQSALPGVQQWVVAGHSLGGAVASGQTEGAAGLILLGSYPINDISDVTVPVLSVSASNDRLATPEDVEQSRATLPKDTQFVVIDGGVHAYFGDYGPQRGDGEPTITREQQQQQTQSEIESLLGRIAPPAR